MKNVNIDKLFPTNIEGTLEILDGKMIFNDYENDRKVCLNFTYDEKSMERKVEVTTLYYSDLFTLYRFTDSSTTFSRFEIGKDYSDFKKRYNENPDSAISYTTQYINVKNGGTYVVDALCYDENNNIFAGRANSEINVVAPDICLTTYIYDSSSNNEFNREGNRISSTTLNELSLGYNDYPILKYKEKFHINSDTSINLSVDRHPYEYISEDGGPYVNISNLADKFNVIGVDGNVFVLKRDSLENGAIMMGDDDLFSSYRYEFDEDVDICAKDIMKRLNDVTAKVGTCADVTVTLYNELGEFPVIIYPGKLISVNQIKSKYGYSDYEYRLSFDTNVLTSSDFDYILNYIKKPNISVYIQPTWAFEFYVKNVYNDKGYFETVLSKSFPFSRIFKKGDISKAILGNSISTFERYGQCAYSVKTQKGDNIELYGSINNEYTPSDYSFDYIKILVQKDSSTFDVKTYIDGNDYLYDASANKFMIYKNCTNNCMIPAFKGSESESSFIIYYSPCVYDSNMYARPIISLITEESGVVKLNYITHAHNMFTRYIESVQGTDLKNNMIYLADNIMNNTNIDYIDRTFTASMREFNVDTAQSYWKNEYEEDNLANLNGYNCPVTTKYDTFILKPDLIPVLGGSADESTSIWKIYERDKGLNTREMIMECFNEVAFVGAKKDKIYDVELMLFDKYGNKYYKSFVGAVFAENDEEYIPGITYFVTADNMFFVTSDSEKIELR